MEPILTESNYKQVINRIAILSAITLQSNKVSEELKNLSLLAIDYETYKYDFSLSSNYQD